MFAVFRPSRKICVRRRPPQSIVQHQISNRLPQIIHFFCEREDARAATFLTRRICWLERWNPRQRHADAAVPQHAIIRPCAWRDFLKFHVALCCIRGV